MICKVKNVFKQEMRQPVWRHFQYILESMDGKEEYIGGIDVAIYPGRNNERPVQIAQALDKVWHVEKGDLVEFNQKNAMFPILRAV